MPTFTPLNISIHKSKLTNMITKENFKALAETINKEDIINVINAAGDYVIMQAHIFNAGAHATIQSVDYDDFEQEVINFDGDLYADKDDFLRLLNEAGIDIY